MKGDDLDYIDPQWSDENEKSNNDVKQEIKSTGLSKKSNPLGRKPKYQKQESQTKSSKNNKTNGSDPKLIL